MDHSDNKCRSNQRTSIERRYFLKKVSQTGGFLSALVLSSGSLATQSLFGLNSVKPSSNVDTTPEAISLIEPSIKANFGAGFRVLSCRKQEHQTHAVIEHLQNHYCVASTDQQNWRIIQSSEI